MYFSLNEHLIHLTCLFIDNRLFGDYNIVESSQEFSMQTNTRSLQSIPDEVVWKSLTNLVERFDLKESEARILMGDMPRSTYTSHKAKLNRDQKERVSYLLGIYKSLRILFEDGEQARTWINRKNDLPPFKGLTPKEYMLEGGMVRLADVRKFLDFWRGY
ncbi:TPA: DUF2384 domain-containing protein [Legionella pneumophila subsp. pneumophila]|uniref:DUF2384 domain-containing protein n=2 Tax=Legionella pneumophila TaxID=446 RepID=A0A3A6VCR9_LEGPN|nr:DUF2384 domain-containing protein [Legionella pneumophila]RJY25187.1 DUF2384 domain-containing protein [Legionella pneumophila subsp. pneumophila]PYB42969.1 DUF2384 domain-containing protein [Legionella pneumophila]PYB60982.1 DUF2384 domain-containing protein [Legionella pneumophila]RJY27542.1 DUF2384 domain-containing protein [Legionella pneumophila subsp. pneumophila]